jgi:hypothetical protein
LDLDVDFLVQSTQSSSSSFGLDRQVTRLFVSAQTRALVPGNHPHSTCHWQAA